MLHTAPSFPAIVPALISVDLRACMQAIKCRSPDAALPARSALIKKKKKRDNGNKQEKKSNYGSGHRHRDLTPNLLNGSNKRWSPIQCVDWELLSD